MSRARLLRLVPLLLAFAATPWLSGTSALAAIEIGVRSEGPGLGCAEDSGQRVLNRTGFLGGS